MGHNHSHQVSRWPTSGPTPQRRGDRARLLRVWGKVFGAELQGVSAGGRAPFVPCVELLRASLLRDYFWYSGDLDEVRTIQRIRLESRGDYYLPDRCNGGEAE